MSPGQFFNTPLLGAGAKWRIFAEPLIRRARADADESVAQFAARRLGREVVDYAINPLVGGIYAGDPEKLSMRHAFPTLHRFDRDHGSLLLGGLAARRARRRAGIPRFKSRSISFRSGLQAIITASQAIMLGETDVTVAGGAENMSRSPYVVPAMRFGARMNDATMIDMMVGALSDPFDDVHMGVTAENVAKKYKVSRADQDKVAAESHRRAGHAIDKGYFKGQIVPVEIKVKGGKVDLDPMKLEFVEPKKAGK